MNNRSQESTFTAKSCNSAASANMISSTDDDDYPTEVR